ncbi:uncharacterized protein LOC122253457 [Penaeus japonicus]|uniref:uncharacterized protein LOC122253457 n=1 Tax=Penaeus japonicus TaxID=27405 RepID=UPI001C7102E0|nr:uncharacterized protein LOC122253457 [Penaeus japonicus]
MMKLVVLALALSAASAGTIYQASYPGFGLTYGAGPLVHAGVSCRPACSSHLHRPRRPACSSHLHRRRRPRPRQPRALPCPHRRQDRGRRRARRAARLRRQVLERRDASRRLQQKGTKAAPSAGSHASETAPATPAPPD